MKISHEGMSCGGTSVFNFLAKAIDRIVGGHFERVNRVMNRRFPEKVVLSEDLEVLQKKGIDPYSVPRGQVVRWEESGSDPGPEPEMTEVEKTIGGQGYEWCGPGFGWVLKL